MRRIIELTPEQDRSILKLVEARRYENFQHFLSAAVDNQLILEHAESGEPLPSSTDIHGARTAERDTPSAAAPIQLARIETVQPLAEGELYGGDDPDRWLWGQINSVLAIKFACREVAHLLLNSGDVPLYELGLSVARAAAEFRGHLLIVDARRDHRRGEKLATSFPYHGLRDSADRFAHQYIGTRRRDGRYDGALFQLGLLGVTSEARPRLTAIGAEFAELTNPVMDGTTSSGGRWFSDEEEDFYLRRVAACIPAERNPMKWAVTSVQAGAKNRPAMNTRLSAAHPGWSEAQVDTYRVGATSRLVQLRVLQVMRNGRDIRYDLGPNAGLALRPLEAPD